MVAEGRCVDPSLLVCGVAKGWDLAWSVEDVADLFPVLEIFCCIYW